MKSQTSNHPNLVLSCLLPAVSRVPVGTSPTSAVKNKKLLFFKHFVLKKVKSRHYILLSGPEFSYVWASLSPCVAG